MLRNYTEIKFKKNLDNNKIMHLDLKKNSLIKKRGTSFIYYTKVIHLATI